MISDAAMGSGKCSLCRFRPSATGSAVGNGKKAEKFGQGMECSNKTSALCIAIARDPAVFLDNNGTRPRSIEYWKEPVR